MTSSTPQPDQDPAVRFTGPLTGLRVVEIGSLGPGPFCAMVLADLGADIIRVDRAAGATLVGPNDDFRSELLNRGRRSVAIDLKHHEGPEAVLTLVEHADVLIEGFRPGVAERLGIGPEAALARNPRLVYGRMTGFGQTGPLAQQVGHDLNYVAQSGVLSLIGRRGQPPTPPLSLVGDFGGGGMVLALGILAAVYETRTSGLGQVIDASMTDGAAVLAAAFTGFAATGVWNPERGTNVVDSGAPYYDAYETSDGRYIAVAAMEPRFYAELIDVLGFTAAELPEQEDQAHWPETKERFARRILTKTRDAWVALAAGRDACLSRVLDIAEAQTDPHNVDRGTFVDVAGITQPRPAPRFSRTPAEVDAPPPLPGEHSRSAPASWGIAPSTIDGWVRSGAVAGDPGPV